jgi:DNA polymerase-3 subunit alpha
MEQLKKEKEVIGIYLSGHPLDPYRIEVEKLTSHPLIELKELKPLKGIDIKVIGIVSSVNHRMSKNGKPYGSFVIEDFTGSYEFTLFGENYLNFKKYMDLEYFLYIKGKIDNRWNKEDDFEFKINSIEMLQEIRDKYIKNVSLEIELEKLNNELITKIFDNIKNNSGSTILNFIVSNKKEQMALSMRSTKFKVDVTNETLKFFDELGLTYKLN